MAAGVFVGSLLGIALELVLFRSGYIAWLLDLIPENQGTIRLLFGLIFTYLTIAIGAGAGGALTGYFMWLVDKVGSKMRYVWGSAWAFAVGQGILLVPMLLFFLFSAMYQNGVLGEQVKYGIMFTLFGVIYGVIVGIVLAFTLAKLRYSWLLIVASAAGFGIGAGLIGYGLRHVNTLSISGIPALTNLLRLFLFALVFTAIAGALLGMVLTWMANKREVGAVLKPSRVQVGVLVGVSAVILLLLMGLTNDIVDFIIIRPGSTTTQLSLSTQGVHWSEPQILANQIVSNSAAEPALAVADSGLVAAAWASNSTDGSDIYYRSTTAKAFTVDDQIVNVSNQPGSVSIQPQLVIDRADRAHILWQELAVDGFAYSICESSGCSEPEAVFADRSDLACANDLGSDLITPELAIDDNDTIMAVWNAGQGLAYSMWKAGERPSSMGPSSLAQGCIPDAREVDGGFALQGDGDNHFALGFDTQGVIWLQEYESGQWAATASALGNGSNPDIMISADGGVQIAWCDAGQAVQYQAEGGAMQTIAFPTCQGRPVLAEDREGNPHLLWYSDVVENIFGAVTNNHLIYESVLTEEGWSEPAIVSRPSRISQPVVATHADGVMYQTWPAALEGKQLLAYAIQEPYECSEESLSRLDAIVLDVIENGGYHPEGYQSPHCRNQYLTIVYTPNAAREALPSVPTPNGGFDKVSAITGIAQYEILFTTMMWDPADEQYLNPGSVFANEVAKLYHAVKANPANYPKGLTVRLLLGNYPNASQLQWGDQIWPVLDELRHAGVEEMVNPDIGWKLEVANYPGVMPHSHTKFVVVDGVATMGAGFNYGYLHFPKEHPSGKGDDLVDLAIATAGPVAQVSLATYDDMWEGANQKHCSDFHPADGSDWKDTCVDQKAVVSHVPEVLKFELTTANASVYSLYRTGVYKEADEAIGAALASAEESIDIFHVNFAMEMICGASIINPDLCNFNDNALPWMRAVMEAVETNQAHVRVIAENSNMNGMENRIGMLAFRDELERRGLSDYAEFRFYEGRIHAKALSIDDEMLVIGSQNLHYSAWGEGGLLEYSIATTDPTAVDNFQQLYNYEWERATPLDETAWVSAPS